MYSIHITHYVQFAGGITRQQISFRSLNHIFTSAAAQPLPASMTVFHMPRTGSGKSEPYAKSFVSLFWRDNLPNTQVKCSYVGTSSVFTVVPVSRYMEHFTPLTLTYTLGIFLLFAEAHTAKDAPMSSHCMSHHYECQDQH